MKPTKIFLMLAAVIALFATTACNSDTPSGSTGIIPPNSLYDFATLASSSSSGSTFTLNKANNSETVTYTSTVQIDTTKGIKVGDRLIIVYTMSDGLKAYESGPINLYGYIMMNNSSQNVEELEGNWVSSPLIADVITRTGTYLNFQLQLFARNNLTQGNLSLVVDPATIDSAVPNLYLVYDNQNVGDNKYTAYASFDISSIWLKSTCKGINVTYQTDNGVKSMKFDNDGNFTPIPQD